MPTIRLPLLIIPKVRVQELTECSGAHMLLKVRCSWLQLSVAGRRIAVQKYYLLRQIRDVLSTQIIRFEKVIIGVDYLPICRGVLLAAEFC